MQNESMSLVGERSGLLVGMSRHDSAEWHCHSTLRKFDMRDVGDLRLPTEMTDEEILRAMQDAGLTPYEVLEIENNILTYGGVGVLWEALIGGTATVFSNANARIGVGDSNTAAAATQTDLQASTNKLRKAMDATFPTHTDGTTAPAASVVFQSTFGTSDANWAWQEWAIFNAASAGRMLNRKVESLGTKTSAGSWVLALQLTLA